MTTLTENNLSNPKLAGFIKPFSDRYKSGAFDFDLTIATCAKYVQKTINNEKNKTLESNYGRLLRFRDIIELNIVAKERYYTNTLFGKIDAFFQTFFKNKFGSSTSIEKAQTVLTTCKTAIDTMVLGGLEPPSSKEEQNLNLKSCIMISRIFASVKKQAYIYNVEEESKGPHSEILFAKPNGDVYHLSRLEGPLGKGASRRVYRGDLYTRGSSSKKEIAILTTMPQMNLSQYRSPTTRAEKEERIKTNTQDMQREQIQLRQLKNSEGVIHNRDFFVTQIDNVPMGFAMTDLYELGDLNKFFSSLEHKQLMLDSVGKLSLMKSLSKNINDLHSQNKIHRDLKNANILVKGVKQVGKKDELKTVLIDFESCIDSNDKKRKKERVGTLAYYSPEYFAACTTENGDEVAKATNPATDMWALGLIYYRIYYGRDLTALSPGNTPAGALQATFDHIQQGHGDPENGQQGDTTIFPNDPIGQTIKQMLAIDPKERLTANKLDTFWKKHPTGQ